MLNAKTGVDFFLGPAPWSTPKHTSWRTVNTVDPNPPRPPTPSDSNRTVAEGTIQQKNAFFQVIFQLRLVMPKVVLSQSGWMVVFLLELLTVSRQNAHWRICRVIVFVWSWVIFFFFILICKKAISVRFESPFVIGLLYSTVIYIYFPWGGPEQHFSKRLFLAASG